MGIRGAENVWKRQSQTKFLIYIVLFEQKLIMN